MEPKRENETSEEFNFRAFGIPVIGTDVIIRANKCRDRRETSTCYSRITYALHLNEEEKMRIKDYLETENEVIAEEVERKVAGYPSDSDDDSDDDSLYWGGDNMVPESEKVDRSEPLKEDIMEYVAPYDVEMDEWCSRVMKDVKISEG
jgi:hypothetical protein